MLKTLAASKAAKVAAACICPVAGMGAVTMAVPQVKKAVHKATAPAPKKAGPKRVAYAKPKTRVRSPLTQAAAGIEPCPPALPIIVQPDTLTPTISDATPIIPVADLPPELVSNTPLTPGTPGVITPTPFFPGTPGIPPTLVVAPPTTVTPTTPVIPPVAAVPEPTTWMQMILGFGIIGFTMRAGVRRSTKAAAKA